MKSINKKEIKKTTNSKVSLKIGLTWKINLTNTPPPVVGKTIKFLKKNTSIM